ncbi:MAG: shikimate kinase AroK [Gammaproteobacteria bacterium]|nr:shikimate kinase AroK [Gammaproteobacteria bacterium]MCW8840184.1 shikimate kinase AroK [Gammaproteobacteria bacterium]MCW8959342.1 shikimate kinase AroK [Gammaproteobacteria bacterium]MCW8972539.1 shikimate kinase AroK [Gammaproteobacteria bacterium]MCW8993151.1 shikimate kinase AroK [Gammaproteobacteria bacterium]
MAVNRLFLVGPMGAGKSTIGRQLSNVLKKEFKDSDHEIVARTGASIPLIFEIEGEEGFRKREAAMIDELTQRQNIVLATGGGAVLREENRRHLRERGVVLYLFASLDQLYERTCRDRNRPLLQTENPRGKLEELLAQRDPLYREVADMVVHTDDRSIKSVVKEILIRLERESKSKYQQK